MKEKIGIIIVYIFLISFLLIGATLFFFNTTGHGFITKISIPAEILSLIISGIVFIWIFISCIKIKQKQETERRKWGISLKIILSFLISLWVAFLVWGFVRQFFY